MIYEANYGVLDIDWEAGHVNVSVRGEGGTPFLQQKIELSKLKR